jgi:hypothetical protein
VCKAKQKRASIEMIRDHIKTTMQHDWLTIGPRAGQDNGSGVDKRLNVSAAASSKKAT